MPSDFHEPLGGGQGVTGTGKKQPPPITISGGAGGIDADLTDMETVATRLGTVGTALTAMWTNASADLASVSVDTDAALCAGTAATAIADMGPLTTGPTSLLITGTTLTGLRDAVSGCKDAYELQDLLRKDGFVDLLRTGEVAGLTRRAKVNLARCGAGLAVYYLNHGKMPSEKDMSDYIPVDSAMTHRMLGGLFALTSPAVRRARTANILGPEMPVHVGSARPEAPTGAPRRVKDLVGKVSMPSGQQDEVRLTRVSDGKGGHAWVVAIPGTDNFKEQKSGGTTRDSKTNLLALLGGRPLAMDGIHAALERQMRAVGADPAKEPVMLVGHSQGGILAARLAGDDAFRKTFRVKSVLTSGAPVSRLVPPSDVQMLSLEHTSDSVPQLDGRKPLDRPNVTVVTRDTVAAPPDDPVERLMQDGIPPGQGLLNPHRETVYQETAESVDIAEDDSSLARWRQDSAEFMAGESQESWTVDMTRDEGQKEKLKVDP